MKSSLPFLSNGATYCTLADGTRRCTGSQMGRRNVIPEALDRATASPKLRLVRLRWVGGDYDEAGAYWGRSPRSGDVYRAVTPFDSLHDRVEIFVRAHSRDAAKAAVRETLPQARFFK